MKRGKQSASPTHYMTDFMVTKEKPEELRLMISTLQTTKDDGWILKSEHNSKHLRILTVFETTSSLAFKNKMVTSSAFTSNKCKASVEASSEDVDLSEVEWWDDPRKSIARTSRPVCGISS
ncbi:hypothetical protein V6N12_023403 [Hibiscus sabdariffa]|uniref:Uncharacterized protein n=1 Tax=Hibiscus sabdariffa TaxID=183260 RepID=A0ABR2FY13_9ROSI